MFISKVFRLLKVCTNKLHIILYLFLQILIRPYKSNERDPSTFRWLALMLVIQVATSLLTKLKSTNQVSRTMYEI